MLKIFWFFKVLKDVYRKRADVTLFFFKKRGHRGNVIKTQGFPWAALGSLTLVLSAQVPFPKKISCFVSTCVFLDNSFPSVRQEPTFRS